MDKKFFVALGLLVFLLACEHGTEGVTGSSSRSAEEASAWTQPECLELRNSGGSDMLVLCSSDMIFTYLVAPEITADFSRKGFSFSPYIMYGPPVHVEGLEVHFSSHPRASATPPKTVILGSEGGFVRRDRSYIFVNVRSFVSDRQGHKFYSEYSGVSYE